MSLKRGMVQQALALCVAAIFLVMSAAPADAGKIKIPRSKSVPISPKSVSKPKGTNALPTSKSAPNLGGYKKSGGYQYLPKKPAKASSPGYGNLPRKRYQTLPKKPAYDATPRQRYGNLPRKRYQTLPKKPAYDATPRQRRLDGPEAAGSHPRGYDNAPPGGRMSDGYDATPRQRGQGGRGAVGSHPRGYDNAPPGGRMSDGYDATPRQRGRGAVGSHPRGYDNAPRAGRSSGGYDATPKQRGQGGPQTVGSRPRGYDNAPRAGRSSGATYDFLPKKRYQTLRKKPAYDATPKQRGVKSAGADGYSFLPKKPPPRLSRTTKKNIGKTAATVGVAATVSATADKWFPELCNELGMCDKK